MKMLKTTRQVVGALGGIKATASLMGSSYNTVTNCFYAKKFPSNQYYAAITALHEKGLDAPPSLWLMRMPNGHT